MVTYKFLCTLALFFSAVSAMPLTRLAARATKCGDGGISPCACNGALGLRKSTLACPADSFRFKNPFDQKDGTIVPTAGNAGSGLQCDHLVELQFIAKKIDAAMCAHFQSAAGAADFKAFFATVNNQPNLELVEGTVNNAKGILFTPKDAFGSDTTEKAADGLASYLGLVKTAKIPAAARAIDNKMTTIMTAIQGTGFTNFVADYEALVNRVIATANREKSKQPPAPVSSAPGLVFCDVTDSTAEAVKKAKAKPRRNADLWSSARDFVIRAVTGKKPATTAANGAACQLPPPKGAAKTTGAAAAETTKAAAVKATKAATAKTNASPAAAKPKTAAATKAKTAATAKKPVTKAATPKKAPVKAATPKKAATKAATTKKTAAKPVVKKPVTKATTAKKPATAAKKPAAKKPAAKKVAVKTPAVKKPAVKKVVTKKPTVKKPAVKKPAAKKVAGKKSTAKKAKKL